MASVFTMIIEGDLPGTFVWKDDQCVAFMSINPISYGHTLVVPRDEIDQWTDVPSDLQRHLFEVAGQIGTAQKQAFNTQRVGMVIAGFEVPHTHIHLIPINTMADMDFSLAATSVDPEELDNAAVSIKTALGTTKEC
ncbi:MAG TPA: HIT family protein [Acidimicrobiaceae bacterium]|nr:HIT family protein [Acidimicrobiaceae bacterium]HAX04787.1 HIT family protein [Acidimicrobiaceae bacterium]